MVARGLQSSEQSIAQVFSPLRSVPTEQGDKSVTTSSAVLFADATTTNGYGCRRVRIYNTDSSATVGLFFKDAGATVTGLAITAAVKLAPGATFETVIGTNIRVAAISSTGTVTVNVLVHDLL